VATPPDDAEDVMNDPEGVEFTNNLCDPFRVDFVVHSRVAHGYSIQSLRD
jgi:hypothetical protein